jgi:hypothetical protein
VVNDLGGDRTQDRGGNRSSAVRTYDDKVGPPPPGLFNDHARGSAAESLRLERDLRLPKRLRERRDIRLKRGDHRVHDLVAHSVGKTRRRGLGTKRADDADR